MKKLHAEIKGCTICSKQLPNEPRPVHPSPRNKIGQKKNPWFENEVVPFLQETIKKQIR